MLLFVIAVQCIPLLFHKDEVMRNIKFKLSAFLLIYVGLPSLIYALSQHSMVPANSIILNLDQAISTTISNSKFTKIFSENILPSKQFIAFPKEIPFNSGKLYASASQHTMAYM